MVHETVKDSRRQLLVIVLLPKHNDTQQTNYNVNRQPDKVTMDGKKKAPVQVLLVG